MKTPKPLDVDKPVKLIFAGGFLGSGKTTALGVLARDIIRQGLRVGIVTNDQSGNLADTVIVQQMLSELNVPVEEVVEGCFCCKFDDLIHQIEKILVHNPDILLGEPVGSCTDFVAAVAHPIKINYQHAFSFAPFSTMVDPDRIRELLLKETESAFPEEVAYLFEKQLEEADLIILNKCDLLESDETQRLVSAIQKRFPAKDVLVTSALKGDGMQSWLDILLSGRPGSNTVLGQIDYDKYARAEAILGWLNAAIKIRAEELFDTSELIQQLILEIRKALRQQNAGIGHLKLVLTAGGQSTWANLTDLNSEPRLSQLHAEKSTGGTLLLNARVKMEPQDLETIVRDSIAVVEKSFSVHMDIIDLQCFSPAYPNPPYRMQEEDKS